MRIDLLIQRSFAEIKTQRLELADIEIDRPEEVISNFCALLNKAAMAVRDNEHEVFKLLLQVIGVGGLEVEGSSHLNFPHIDRSAAMDKLLKALATPANVAAIHVPTAASRPTSLDSLSAIGLVLQEYQQWLRDLLVVASKLAKVGAPLGMMDLLDHEGDTSGGSVQHALARIGRSNAVAMLMGLSTFIECIITPLCGTQSKAISAQQSLMIKDTLGQMVLPPLWTIIEICQQLLRGDLTCGVLHVCGGSTAFQELSGDTFDSTGRQQLTQSPSPIIAIVSSARRAATAIIALLKGSKENKKRLFSFSDVSTHFLRVQGEEILAESFLIYQKHAATLLGRLLLPHPPVAAMAQFPTSTQTATSRASSSRRGHNLKTHVGTTPSITMLRPMLTSCLDPFLQLQLCEIVVRARMYKVDEFKKFITTPRIGQPNEETNEAMSASGTYYEQLDRLISQLPVSDPSTLFVRMWEMLRDMNEFVTTSDGCTAMAGIVPPVPIHTVAWEGYAENIQSQPQQTLPTVLSKQFYALLFSDQQTYPFHTMRAFEVLRLEACVASAPQPIAEPIALFDSTLVHFSSAFLLVDVPTSDGSPPLARNIIVPYDTIRSVRLSKDKSVFVLRLDGGMGIFGNEGNQVINRAIASADDDDMSYVYNVGGANENEATDDLPMLQSRIPMDLQKEILRAAAANKIDISSVQSAAPDNNGELNRQLDITLQLVVTKGTAAAIMATEIHKRIDTLRKGFGAALCKSELKRSVRDEIDNKASKRLRSEPAPHLTSMPSKPIEVFQPLDNTDSVLHLPSNSEPEYQQIKGNIAASADESSEKVLQMVAAVLDEHSMEKKKLRRLDLLAYHKAKIQSYIDSYRGESAELEDLYVKDVNAALEELQSRQKQLSAHVRTAVGELNEGVDMLRGVETSLKTKLTQVEDSFENMDYTKPVKDEEMAGLRQIKSIVDASVRSMETFLRCNITGRNPLKILEQFVSNQEERK